MRWLPLLGLMMGLSGGAQAFTLFETEPNDCFCEATPGGTAQTTFLSGVLTGADIDSYRFDFAQPVPYLSIRPVSPNIAGDDSYGFFDIELWQSVSTRQGEFFDLMQTCEDCWFGASAIEAYDLPAGTYYIVVVDENSLITPAATVNNAPELPPTPLSLGAYTVALSTTVPEPATLALFGTALLGLALRRRRA